MKNNLRFYSLALLIAILSVCLQTMMAKSFSENMMISLLYPGTLIAAYYLGTGPTLLLLILNTLQLVLVPTTFSGQDIVKLLTYIFTSLLMIRLSFRARVTRIDLEQSKARLRESEHLFRKVADEAPALIWKSDEKLGCDWVNKGYLKFTGKTLEEELGNGWQEEIHPDDFANNMQIWLEKFHKKQSIHLQYRLRRFDGEYRWILNNGVPRFSHQGEFLGYIGTSIDIHEQVDALQIAKEAINVRDEFLSICTHELRTPLTPLRMHLEGMGRLINQRDYDNLQKMAETSLRQVKRISSLVEDLLDVARISSGHLTLNLENTDIVEVVSEVCERYRPQIIQAGAELFCKVPSSFTAQVDRLRFEQILINLITNALRYAPGKPIEVELKKNEQDFVLKVRDHGIGIAEADRDRIFERYERGSASLHYGGLGLGLYIVKQILQAHGGSVSVESWPSKGALFCATLPIRGIHGP